MRREHHRELYIRIQAIIYPVTRKMTHFEPKSDTDESTVIHGGAIMNADYLI